MYTCLIATLRRFVRELGAGGIDMSKTMELSLCKY
jgi:hypothetical protein